MRVSREWTIRLVGQEGSPAKDLLLDLAAYIQALEEKYLDLRNDHRRLKADYSVAQKRLEEFVPTVPYEAPKKMFRVPGPDRRDQEIAKLPPTMRYDDAT